MALTGPIQAPLAFHTTFEVDDLVKFLTKIQMDLDTRFDVISEMMKCVEPDEHGHLRFDNIRKMLENVVSICESIAVSMGSFSHGLAKKKLIKRNTSLPQIILRKNADLNKRDSGIDSEKVSANWSFTSENSENRLSVFEEEGPYNPNLYETNERKVSFEIMSPSQSDDALEQQDEADDISLPVEKNEMPHLTDVKTSLPATENSFPTGRNSGIVSEDGNGNIFSDECNHKSVQVEKESISIVYVHLIPTDQSTDLSVIQEDLLKFSNSMITQNVKLELVTSDIFIGLTSRQISSSSSDSQTFTKNGFKTSEDPLTVRALNNLSRFAVENSETSDDDNRSFRLISSSDSETSVRRYHLKPVIEKISVETQTYG